MPIDFNHHWVGRSVLWERPWNIPEEGVITSVNKECNLVFVRYGSEKGSKATYNDSRLKFINGERIEL